MATKKIQKSLVCNQIHSKRKAIRYQLSNLIIENKTVFNLSTIANYFNYFFTNFAGEIDKMIGPNSKMSHDYLCNPNKTSFYLSPICKEDIEDIISTIRTDKACGPNSIPTRMLKDFKKELSKPLSDVINISFSSGVFPNSMKLAKVVPVYKKDDKFNCNNYRPISLLPNLSKIFGRLVHQKLTLFLENNKQLYQFQFGFRSKHSTSHALISLTEKICAALCIQSFYRHLQSLQISGLLFLFYISDLHKAITISKIHDFADDTNFLYESPSLKDIN